MVNFIKMILNFHILNNQLYTHISVYSVGDSIADVKSFTLKRKSIHSHSFVLNNEV